jgi:poly(glycerol-phosphate) alpha-glucosyltransferase
MNDPNSALDVLKWRPLSVRTFRPQSRSWGYSKQLLPALFDANLDILSTHGLWKYCSVASRRWHRQTRQPYIVHPHGMLEPWALQNAKWKKRIAALLYEDRHLHDAACLPANGGAGSLGVWKAGLITPECNLPEGFATHAAVKIDTTANGIAKGLVQMIE